MMSSKKSTVPFAGTPEQEEELRKVIDAHKHQEGALMQILQEAQDIYGYLPQEVQTIISDEMDIPLEKIYGVVNFFFSFFLFPPKVLEIFKINLRNFLALKTANVRRIESFP